MYSIQTVLSLPDEMRLFICHDYGPSGRAIAWETTIAQQRADNIHVGAGESRDAFIKFLADLGFAFFMFLAGLELDFRGVERRGILAGLPALLQCSASFLLAFFLGQRLGLSLWLSLAAGAISVPLMVKMRLGLEPGRSIRGDRFRCQIVASDCLRDSR